MILTAPTSHTKNLQYFSFGDKLILSNKNWRWMDEIISNKSCLLWLWWRDILYLSLSNTQFVKSLRKMVATIERNHMKLCMLPEIFVRVKLYYRYQKFLWELCHFELRNFPKYTCERAHQCNSFVIAPPNLMKFSR